LLPEKVIPARIERGVVVPFFLTTQDHPWLAILIEEIDRFSGRPRRELWERLRAPLPCAVPFFKGRAATAVLLRLWRAVEEAAVAPPAAREAVFVAAAAAPAGATRAGIFAEAAAALGVGGDAGLEGALFADLPGERIVRAPSVVPPAAEAALRVNLAIARSLLQRASIISIQLEGAARPVVRQAQWRGLLCTLRAAEPPELEVSGPFALFRRTVLYGRALGEMLPFLARTGRYQLRARC
jgi:predicted nuclease of restriction endonuclease-like RecB superfamily